MNIVGEYLEQPDPDDPDSTFGDRRNLYQIDVWPAAFPTRFTQGPVGAWNLGIIVAYILLAVFGTLIARLIDRRYKVVVSRIARRRMSAWGVIALSFHATEEAAEAYRAELMANWESARYETLPTMSGARQRALRKAGRSADVN